GNASTHSLSLNGGQTLSADAQMVSVGTTNTNTTSLTGKQVALSSSNTLALTGGSAISADAPAVTVGTDASTSKSVAIGNPSIGTLNVGGSAGNQISGVADSISLTGTNSLALAGGSTLTANAQDVQVGKDSNATKSIGLGNSN